MQKQTVRILLYSSLAIVLLASVWALKQVPEQNRLAEQTLRESLDQEMIVLSSAVKASNEALKYRLLDVLKAEGNDHTTRSFQDSPFFAAALLEWDQVEWKSLWYSVKSKTDLQSGELKGWLKSWPLSQLSPDEAHYVKVADIQGVAYFALLVPVRRPNQTPMVGVGIFPANQFGLAFASDESRDVRVFDQSGSALALSRPAYLGSSLRTEPLVKEMLDGDEVSVRHEWKSERGPRMVGQATRIADSNLYAAIETKAVREAGFLTYLYLGLSALGAIALNWVLFSGLLKPLFAELEDTEAEAKQLRRLINERIEQEDAVTQTTETFVPKIAAVPRVDADEPPPFFAAKLADHTFAEAPAPETSPAPVVEIERTEPVNAIGSLAQTMEASLRAFKDLIKDHNIDVLKSGLDKIDAGVETLQLQTAFEEILKNAIEAMASSERRVLSIQGRSLDGLIHVAIQDSGCGISDENLPKVFDPFFSTKDTEGVARGLGLNVVRRVVEEFRGHVRVHTHGGGTTVELEWPIEASAKLHLVEEAKPTPPSPKPYSLEDLENEVFAFLEPAKSPSQFAIRKPKVRSLD